MMSDCGCTTPACSCQDTTDAHALALSIGGSIGSLVAEVAARLSVGTGAQGRTHARNRAMAGLGLPYVNPSGELVTSAGTCPVGYGLNLPDPNVTLVGRSAGWRQLATTADAARHEPGVIYAGP